MKYFDTHTSKTVLYVLYSIWMRANEILILWKILKEGFTSIKEVSEWVIEWAVTEGVGDRVTDEWMSGSEWVTERVNEWQWMSQWINEWEWMSEQKWETVTEWATINAWRWMSDWMRVFHYKDAAFIGIYRCGSFPLLSASHSLFCISKYLKRPEKIPGAPTKRWGEWIWLTGPSGLHRNLPQG